MTRQLRVEMRKKARRARGITNLLADDIFHVYSDANDYDLLCLGESINDTKETLQMLIDAITELEYDLYLARSNDSRN